MPAHGFPDSSELISGLRNEVASAVSSRRVISDDRSRVELVETDVGPMLFPAWDKVMLPAISDTGAWEVEEAAWIRSRLHPGMVALDIGTNVGYHAVMMARAVSPDGLVIAVEPDPMNCAILRSNLVINNIENVCVLNVAAGDYSGTTDFTLDAVNAGDHRSYRRAGAPETSVVSVPIVRLDEVLDGIDIDFALIDTQSFDHRVIKGMEKLVSRLHPPMLVEYWTEGLIELGEDPAQVIEFYRSLGYRTQILEHPDFSSDAPAHEFVEITDKARGRYVSLILSTS